MRFLAASFLVFVVASLAAGQVPNQKDVIFAVLDNGGTLEPIAYLNNKKLEIAVDGASERDVLAAFHSSYLKSRTSYALIFGGVKAGTVTVNASDPANECSKHTAQVTTAATRAKLKGNVMGLATSATVSTAGDGMRRAPTASERAAIETLVRSTFSKNKISAATLRNLRYQNLTAIDPNGDGVVEFVGSYWVAPTANSRALVFFIAEKRNKGAYSFAVSDFSRIAEADVMGDDIGAIDNGVHHELLLDVFDYDSDGTKEIFTYAPSFEGAGFTVYRRDAGKWVKAFEASNYRCAF